jgi:hypothetical protein
MNLLVQLSSSLLLLLKNRISTVDSLVQKMLMIMMHEYCNSISKRMIITASLYLYMSCETLELLELAIFLKEGR